MYNVFTRDEIRIQHPQTLRVKREMNGSEKRDGAADVLRNINSQKWQWASHIARMEGFSTGQVDVTRTSNDSQKE